MTSFRILGPVEASIEERTLPLGGPRQLKLLTFLLLRANQAVSTDVLTDVLWGAARGRSDNRPTTAVARLRKALEPLNKGGEPRLRTVSGGYMLVIEPGELDAEVFAGMAEDAQRALDAADAAGASEALSAALSLWRGPPLAEVAFEDFAQAEIRRLEELRLCALEARTDADLHLGRRTMLSSGGMTRLVGRLEQRGLVRRDPDPDDARAFHASLTDAGRSSLAQARITHDNVIANLLGDHLTPSEAQTLTGTLAKVLKDDKIQRATLR